MEKNGSLYSEERAKYKAFMLLTFCVAIVLIGNTISLWFNKIQPDIYKEVLLLLGIPTLLGMAFHAFFNENKKESKNVEKSADVPVGDVPAGPGSQS